MNEPPPLVGILEACLYYSQAQDEEIERFYGEILALELVGRWDGAFAWRLGSGVLLIFGREALAARGGPITAHGSEGPGHLCLLAADPDDYESWAERLREQGVEATHQQRWPGGLRSLYFHDPAGNLLEIADGDIWPPGERAS